jgi:hypothetical protein
MGLPIVGKVVILGCAKRVKRTRTKTPNVGLVRSNRALAGFVRVVDQRSPRLNSHLVSIATPCLIKMAALSFATPTIKHEPKNTNSGDKARTGWWNPSVPNVLALCVPRWTVDPA